MALIDIQTDLSKFLPLFERLVNAVERLAGPPLEIREPPRQATLSDYSYIPPDEEARIEWEKDQLARANQVVPGSQAFLNGVEQYEREIIESYGEQTGRQIVERLPWKVRKEAVPGLGPSQNA